jgi:EAL domain-containing protein (putative c-di-GMP-specific phosphodiesterase class I)
MKPTGESLEIVRGIITLGHSLGKQVIAEGVETGEQLALLRLLGCDYGQGYLFSEPMEPEAARKLLADARTW